MASDDPLGDIGDPVLQQLLDLMREAARARADRLLVSNPLLKAERPEHPDYARLVEVLQLIEQMKERDGDDAEKVSQIYNAFIDSMSVAYAGANRMGMNLPPGIPSHVQHRFHELLTHSWVEGVFVGIYFQILGGHRSVNPLDDVASPRPE